MMLNTPLLGGNDWVATRFADKIGTITALEGGEAKQEIKRDTWTPMGRKQCGNII